MVADIRNKRDVLAGCLVVVLGGAVTLIALRNYKLGTLTQMGPGMFPLMLGIGMTLVGIMIVSAAFLSDDGLRKTILPPQREWRGWACILLGPVAFMVLGQYCGLAAGTFGCVFVSALGDRSSSIKGSAILATVVTVLGCIVFGVFLKLSMPIWRWDF